MDVKTTFLNGVIKEEVYIEQLEGFEVSCMLSEESLVWAEAGTESVVWSNRWLLAEDGVCQE